jgi:hypothetical protein
MSSNIPFGRKMKQTSPDSLGIAISICILAVRRPFRCCFAKTVFISLSQEGKFSHATVWCLQTGYERPDGKRSYPVAAILANLAKPTPDRPALMTHFSVVTLFHELGAWRNYWFELVN